MLFAAPVPEAPDELYVRIADGVVERERAGLTVAPHSRISTNTYFGRFPASYWQRWTEVTKVRWQATVSGAGALRIVASDPRGEQRVAHAVTVSGDEPHEVAVDALLDRFVDGGALWLDITTGAGELVVRDARWTVPTPAQRRPTAVVMPTFNRVAYCLKTLGALSGDRAALDVVTAVYLVDQGSDAVESHPGFADVAAALDGKLRYIRQPNLGGSGGYSRGLFEASANHGEHVNVLFLDDDIWLEPDVVFRLSAFEQHTRKPIVVGGQMLRLLHPDRLHVGAETADLGKLAAGEPVTNALRNANMIDIPVLPTLPETPAPDAMPVQFQQETRVDAGYNGWWACLIPSEVVRDVGYPLPAFFQWDDIEYGYRARGRGYPTVTLPGAGVWHIDFEWKDWDDWHRYFNLRNSMITSALHSDFDRRRIGISLLAQLVLYLVSIEYGLAATLIKAIDDFLAGPEIMRDGGMQAAADIRKLRAEFPETVRYPASDVPGVGFAEAPLIARGTKPGMRKALLVIRFARQLLGRVGGAASIPASSAYWWHVSRFATVVVTDASQEGVRVRKVDAQVSGKLLRQGLIAIARCYRRGPRVARRYRDALPELTSKANWQRLYRTL
jgi:galactofuranosylgalactofuranosylrhamnosyl-N-acetylglucosaminyl-diphospho-decaprenol beta-1,5/1,6-galactofuranosyltransferase